MMIPLVAAHRLQKSNLGAAGSSPDTEHQPTAIIVRFARMIDRDRLLSASNIAPVSRVSRASNRLLQEAIRPQSPPPPPAFDRI